MHTNSEALQNAEAQGCSFAAVLLTAKFSPSFIKDRLEGSACLKISDDWRRAAKQTNRAWYAFIAGAFAAIEEHQ